MTIRWLARACGRTHNAAVNGLSRYVFPCLACVALVSCAPTDAPDTTEPRITAVEVLALPGSMGPNLAVGPDGTTVLSWIEPLDDGHALRYSTLEGSTWSEPATVAVGEDWFVNWADFPSVVPVSESLWGAHWLVSQPAGGYAYDIFAAISTDTGTTWSEPFRPHTDGTETEHGFVSIFADDDAIGMVWLDGRKMVNEYDENDVAASAMTLRTATFVPDGTVSREGEIDGIICDCCQTDVAVTPAGPVAVYRDRSTSEIRDNYVSRRIEDVWQPGQAIADDGWEIAACPVNGPAVVADGNNIAVAWFSAVGDVPKVQFARSTDGGATFAEPVPIATGDNVGRVGVATLPDGRVAVSWVCGSAYESGQVCLRFVGADDELGEVEVISGDDRVPAFSFPQLVSAGDDLYAAWTVQTGDVTTVHSARYSLD